MLFLPPTIYAGGYIRFAPGGQGSARHGKYRVDVPTAQAKSLFQCPGSSIAPQMFSSGKKIETSYPRQISLPTARPPNQGTATALFSTTLPLFCC